MNYINIHEIFGSKVFGEEVMQERLPRDTYDALKRSISEGVPLEISVANVVANAMKDWAVERGATHFSHWFAPMTGITAEKHESFITPIGSGRVIMDFSGSALVRGESDASSFPHGGLRCTFEARGYTIWDTTSYAFLKENTLFIPTAFAAYSGEALDKKTPLLRSMQALNIQALRVLEALKDTALSVSRVSTTVGTEQEYFLIDKDYYTKRPDLVHTGRTLLGAPPPKRLGGHYYGNLTPRISAFMHELELELWKLGVCAKTKHNEAAPAQYELALMFNSANVATDHNQLTMELLKQVAQRHGLVCLLHEKPFAGVNGSGKHNNWSIQAHESSGKRNLLDISKTPKEQFLLFLVAVVKAVDDYQEILRVSTASASNDHRLGGFEAPPALISMFLGPWEEILKRLANGASTDDALDGFEIESLEIGVDALPSVDKDSTDRNRTSPFAFTGNKFEFRMPGSSFSVADANVVLNTAVAKVLHQFANELEQASDVKKAIRKIIKRTCNDHIRIIYSGDGYSLEWLREAEARGLVHHKDSPSAFPAINSEKSISMFTSMGVFTEAELNSRYEMLLEEYSKAVHSEALTMLDIVKTQIAPAVITYQYQLAKASSAKASAGVSKAGLETYFLNKLATHSEELLTIMLELETSISSVSKLVGQQQAEAFRDEVLFSMSKLRGVCDSLERVVSKETWPLPSYADMFDKL